MGLRLRNCACSSASALNDETMSGRSDAALIPEEENDMSLLKKIATATLAAMLATSAQAGDKDIAVIVGSAQDGFWNMVKKGVDDARLMVEANGGTVNFMQTQNYDNFGPDLASLIEQAVAQGALPSCSAILIWLQGGL